jgi:hypothetical protein
VQGIILCTQRAILCVRGIILCTQRAILCVRGIILCTQWAILCARGAVPRVLSLTESRPRERHESGCFAGQTLAQDEDAA